MFFLSPDETLAALTAAFLGGALFGRIVWRPHSYDARIKTAADAMLRRAEEQLRLVHDASPDCFAMLHPVKGGRRGIDFQFVYLNPASEQFTGRKPGILVGRLVSETLPRAANLKAMTAIAELTESGQSYRDEFKLDEGDQGRWVAISAVRIDDAIAVTASDVTARKRGERMLAASNAELERRVEQRTAELEEARERYRLLAEHASDMISTHALDGSFTYAAPALETLLGCKSEDLRGRSPIDFAFPDDRPLIAEGRDRAHRKQGPSLVTWRCRRPDGSYVWLETNGRAVRDPQSGQPLWFVCSSRDITSRKRIEGALRESEQRLRATLETPNLVAVALDPEGVVTFSNEGLSQTTGWTRDDLLGHNWFDVCMPERAVRRAFRSQLRRGKIPARLEREIVCRDGSRRLIEWDNNVLRDPLGGVIGTVSLGVDVTEKRQEETVLQLLQSVTVAAGAAEDIDSALGAMLRSMCESMQWRYGEAWLPDVASARLVRQDVYFATPGSDVAALVESGRGLAIARDEGLAGAVWSNGELKWVEDLDAELVRPRRQVALAGGFRAACAVPVMSGHQVTAVLCFFLHSARRRDRRAAEIVTTVAKQLGSMILRKRAETELRESEARLRAIVRSMNEGLIITDLEDRIRFVNERTLELTGRTEAELIGREAAELLAETDAGDVPKLRLERRRQGLADRYEVRVSHGATAGSWLEITGGPLANADGVIVGTLGTVTDVSERKRNEEAILSARDAAEAASRAKSEFLSRMSHELRTPLNSVIGFARVLRRDGADRFAADDLTYLDRIQVNGEHLLKLVNDLLDVAKIEAGRLTAERGMVRLDALVREIVEQLEGQPRAAGVVLRADVPATPVMIQTDSRLLRQVLINLAGNALRFTHRGQVVISLVVDASNHRPGRIDVTDTGIGIPADRQRAIFEPFEQADSTTSRAYGGTGLGLSIARSLCETLGYRLSLDSTPGVGSTFSVHLIGTERRTTEGEAA
ncbi:MAG TPA: PAS domain S-box protein [Gemmatimonadaceae bacterium]|nr:PAS domain S-box protein [Gemmatimonadaceae bacterium]